MREREVNIMEMERVSTTFWMDFSIAERFGVPAIRDTYDRAFAEWKTDARYLAELVIVLNHKLWYYCEAKNEPMARLYNELWEKADGWAIDNLKGEERRVYWALTD